MSNTYILLKDLPDGSIVGDVYAKYGDQYRNERFRKDKCPVIEDAAWFTWQVENNPEWFKLKEHVEEKRIEVSHFNVHDNLKGNGWDSFFYQFCSSKPLQKELSEQICMAIEYVVNDAFEKITPTPEPQDSKEEPKPLFEEAIRKIINSYSLENESDTPDYIIAQYLANCLTAYTKAVQSRSRHIGSQTN